MSESIDRYSEPFIFFPTLIVFVIVSCIVYRSLGEMEFCQGPMRLVLTLCVSLLGIYGLDRTLLKFIVNHYTYMSVAMLVSLAGALGLIWSEISKKRKK
ncbi:MAG: hypothetical protein ACYSUK_05710 [Planctomycetota bacterium]|jgi:hypothetical protein